MRTPMLIIGIILIAAAVFSLLFAAFLRHAYFNTMDASPEHYARMRGRMTTFFITGLILAVLGAACLIVRIKI